MGTEDDFLLEVANVVMPDGKKRSDIVSSRPVAE